MSIEERLASKMRSVAGGMPVGQLDVESIVAQGRRSLVLHRFALAGVAIVIGIAGFALAERVFFDQRAGEMLPADDPDDRLDMSDHYEEIRTEALAFSRLLATGEARAAWNKLSHRAQVASGGFAAWEEDLPNTRSLFTWIHEEDTAFYFSPLSSTEDRSIVVVTAAAPINEDGSGLLTTFPVQVVDDGVSIDVDTQQRISLVPLDPVFDAGCAGDGCEDPDDFRPTISDGMTFSVSVGPSRDVRQVMFAVGGDAALMLGDQTPPDDTDMVRASALFPGAEASRETVFTVVLETPDGEVEAFGYRVIYEDG